MAVLSGVAIAVMENCLSCNSKLTLWWARLLTQLMYALETQNS